MANKPLEGGNTHVQSSPEGRLVVARIRTIKPELPQSESLGRVSRDARLLFINLWTIADDSGKARAASRLLASLLYPYDEDAPALIDGWLTELEGIGAVRRYVVDGSTYLDIPNWLKHQKIDRPSESRLPSFDESSRGLANDREGSSTDLGPRTMDLGPRTVDRGPRATTHGKATNIINGHDQRRHGSHGWCDRERGKCLPFGLHDELVKGLGGADAEARLKAWYPTVIAKYSGRPIGDDTFEFWRNEFACWVGTVTSRPSPPVRDKATQANDAMHEALAIINADYQKAIGDGTH